MNVIVGNKLKVLRKSKKMSQEEVADYLGISQSAYARMENGESHSWATHILNICDVFEIAPEDLLKSDNYKEEVSEREIASVATTTELSEKVIEQYEERIRELKQTIRDLKKYKNIQ